MSSLPGTSRIPYGDGVSSLSRSLLEILRCPRTGARLVVLDEHHLMSEQPYRQGIHPVYAVVDGIPDFVETAA